MRQLSTLATGIAIFLDTRLLFPLIAFIDFVSKFTLLVAAGVSKVLVGIGWLEMDGWKWVVGNGWLEMDGWKWMVGNGWLEMDGWKWMVGNTAVSKGQEFRLGFRMP